MGKPSDLLQSDRYRSWARKHASTRDPDTTNSTKGQTGNILPTYSDSTSTNETGELSKKHGRGPPSESSAHIQQNGGFGDHRPDGGGGADRGGDAATTTTTAAQNGISHTRTAPTLPTNKSENEGSGDPTIAPDATGENEKPPMSKRMQAGSVRFFVHMKNALTYSWVNVLLLFVPVGIIVEFVMPHNSTVIFAMNAIAIIPLAGLLSYATEAVASRLGDTLGALLNVSFGNAVELIIFIIALVKNEIEIVQASLLGSILANLLLILGMAFLFGGLRYREQVYNSTVTQMSACLLSLSVMSLLLPTAFYASFATKSAPLADKQVLRVSRGVSVVLLLIYVLYLLFQLKSHAYLYESTPQAIIDEESHPGALADMFNSSSSSSDSSSSSSTDSDTSGSGSVAAAGKKIKRVFKNRRRRKSSASTSSANGSATHSALSLPSTQDPQQSHIGSSVASRRGSTFGTVPSESFAEADDHKPRIRDFGDDNLADGEAPKSSERKKHQKKMKVRKHHKKKRTGDTETTENNSIDVLGGPKVQSPANAEPLKIVGFSDKAETAGTQERNTTPSRLPFNRRQISTRGNLSRPGLPSMLSNNVFVTPPPVPAPQPRPNAPLHSQSSGNRIRRTSSLPDRLNQQGSGSGSRPSVMGRSGPLPPFQHQRQVTEAAVDRRDDDDEVDKPTLSRTAAVVLLLCSTALVAVCAEFMVDAIPEMIESSPDVSQAFIGLIILPIVGNAAEHVTAVVVASKNKMDLAIGVAVGSSIQIALFVTPVVVLLGWILDTNMSLYFNLFETISLFVTVFVVNFLVLDGRSNYLEGSLLIAAYVIIALAAFFYPDREDQSQAGGGA